VCLLFVISSEYHKQMVTLLRRQRRRMMTYLSCKPLLRMTTWSGTTVVLSSWTTEWWDPIPTVNVDTCLHHHLMLRSVGASCRTMAATCRWSVTSRHSVRATPTCWMSTTTSACHRQSAAVACRQWAATEMATPAHGHRMMTVLHPAATNFSVDLRHTLREMTPHLTSSSLVVASRHWMLSLQLILKDDTQLAAVSKSIFQLF